MAIPTLDTFDLWMKPLGIKLRIGRRDKNRVHHMAIVRAAVEAYWEAKDISPDAEERLLYNLWKECRKWQAKKQEKLLEKQSELFQRRLNNIKNLQKEAWDELMLKSEKIARALENYKGQGPLNLNMRPLGPGYLRERQWYESQNKSFGFSKSQSDTMRRLGNLQTTQLPNKMERKYQPRFQGKRFEDLTMNEVFELEKVYRIEPVVFRNKIERLHKLVTVREDGKLCDIEDNPVLINAEHRGLYELWMYAMDEYGNLFATNPWGLHKFLNHVKGTGYSEQQTTWFNHSSLLAGKPALCAGCLHIGYNCRTQTLEAGVLSHIDNGSGHYRPTTQNLMNCLTVLADQGVDVERVRVGDASRRDQNGYPTYYWGDDFLNGQANPWFDAQTPSIIGLTPPRVKTTLE